MIVYILFKAIINALYLQHSVCINRIIDHNLGAIFSVVTVLVTKVNRKSKTNQPMHTRFPYTNNEVNISIPVH